MTMIVPPDQPQPPTAATGNREDNMQLVEAIEKLKSHEADLKKMGVEKLYIFGSTVRGDQRPDSDVDLFFDCRSGLSLFDLMDIKEAVSKILGCKADIFPRNNINKFYRPYIEPDAVPVF